MNLFDLSGKTALVTGARKGIGFAMAQILAEYGAYIVAVSSKQSSEDKLSSIVRGYGRSFEGIAADLRIRSQTKDLISGLKGRKIDILINNAGIANRAEVLDHSDEQWDETLEIDLTAPFLLSREIARGMA